MNAPLSFPPVPQNEKASWLKRALQEPLTFVIVIWALMLAVVGCWFTFMD